MSTKITINESFEARGEYTSVSCKAEPIEHTFDAAKLGEGPARAIAKTISDGIKAITASASSATVKRRASARAALARGATWAVERYSGGAPGAASSSRLFNDSGALAHITATLGAGADWAIATVSNRLDPSTLDGGAAALAELLERLVELVPALRDPLSVASVQDAIEQTWSQIFTR